LSLLRENNIGLISVGDNDLDFIINPKSENPSDIISYYFLSELFAKEFKEIPAHKTTHLQTATNPPNNPDLKKSCFLADTPVH
jgi:hypothetical protein